MSTRALQERSLGNSMPTERWAGRGHTESCTLPRLESGVQQGSSGPISSYGRSKWQQLDAREWASREAKPTPETLPSKGRGNLNLPQHC